MRRPSSGKSFLLAVLSLLVSCNLIWLSGCRGIGASPQNNNNAVPQVISFTANSSSVAAGSIVTLSWQTQNATQVSIDNGVGTQPANGSVNVTVNVTTTYTLTAHGASGQNSAPVSATVNVSKTAPTVTLTATPNPVRGGASLTIAWQTTNAASISFNPPISPTEDTPPLPANNSVFLAPASLSTQTITYSATVASADGATATASVNVTVLPPLPTITFNASPTVTAAGQPSALTWSVANAASFSIDNGVGSQPVSSSGSAVGSANVQPQSTTTYTATAVGGDGTAVTAQATVTVNFITLTANPLAVTPNSSTTLTWTAPQAQSVTIDNGIGAVNPASGGSVQTSPLSSTTTFTATATDVNGGAHTASATVTVSQSAGLGNIKHIIFLVQENRSFDNYLGKLNDYRTSKGIGGPNDVDVFDPNVTLVGLKGIPRQPFHERTVQTDNLTPSWNESHFDLHRPSGATSCTPNPGSNCKMDKFMITTNSISEGRTRDPNGDRAVGYYDQTDLPYYYELAAQFATSDRMFSPLLANTIANREYLFSATSQGDVFPPSTNVTCTPTTNPCQFTWQNIFDAMDKATNSATGRHVSWKYYYLDSSVFLSQWNTWKNPADQGNVRCIDEWYKILQDPNADKLLPDVVFIERGGGKNVSPNCVNSAPGSDEHPDANIQVGAANTKKLIDALMNSSAWKDSVFILTYDEGGGLYDHVPPFTEVPPDNIPPKLRSGDLKGGFNESGFRVPFIIISPFVRPNFVSHVNRDNTAILKLIETRFGFPALTARDAAQDDMSEFFDFSNPASPPLLTAPGGIPWTQFLPAQPTNGVANMSLETAP